MLLDRMIHKDPLVFYYWFTQMLRGVHDRFCSATGSLLNRVWPAIAHWSARSLHSDAKTLEMPVLSWNVLDISLASRGGSVWTNPFTVLMWSVFQVAVCLQQKPVLHKVVRFPRTTFQADVLKLALHVLAFRPSLLHALFCFTPFHFIEKYKQEGCGWVSVNKASLL